MVIIRHIMFYPRIKAFKETNMLHRIYHKYYLSNIQWQEFIFFFLEQKCSVFRLINTIGFNISKKYLCMFLNISSIQFYY